ncbi:DEAD/DEAH box helicase family protein [Streptococcus suis]|uniref:DEAD/DEAH box helicase family protein n=1 Tax=Streptococcus suis TaxID=1307 RepID=UPI002412A314|nr:DEAD/DEAH box helicase family protein [Streptococcus suis]MDG4505432.1 DEAD/DEAH box helicase family protein [Streptococcus suis]
MPFIYETYDTVSRSGFKDFRADLPDYLTKNLKHPLRPYQQEAIGRYLHYKTDNNRVIPEQVLYNMATGSGKTLLMAAIILEKYQQGERNFIFFVNNDNILTKTKDNFLESASGKYLFAEKIVMDGRIVTVREVTDFSDSRDDSINIVFTTIQKLHQDLNTPRENRLSYEQFKDISVVMLADEAHHLNAGLSKSEKDDNTSWTSTIEMIQKTAKKSSIFEFTATIDLTNPILAQKYEKSLLFKYDLKEFRLDKYSKDVLFHLVDGDVNHRMLQAIIISQYRKKIALKNGINLKPLVMFKSQKIAESQENLDAFLGLLDNLSLEDIQAQRELVLEMDEKFSILKKAFSYFETVGITDTDLVAELQEDFRKERLLLVDGKNKNKDSLNLLNTLEQPSNEIRAIFAVDMLNEG